MQRNLLLVLFSFFAIICLWANMSTAQTASINCPAGNWSGQWSGGQGGQTQLAYMTISCKDGKTIFSYEYPQYQVKYDSIAEQTPLIRFGNLSFVLGADGNLHGCYAYAEQGKARISLVAMKSKAVIDGTAIGKTVENKWSGNWNGLAAHRAELEVKKDSGNKLLLTYSFNNEQGQRRQWNETGAAFSDVNFWFERLNGAFVLGFDGNLYACRAFLAQDGKARFVWNILKSQ